jgi:hypothetical protein
VAEREAFIREGWAWTGYHVQGHTLLDAAPASDDEPAPLPQQASVRLDFATPTGEHGAYLATVELYAIVETLKKSGRQGIGSETDAPLYRVRDMERKAV